MLEDFPEAELSQSLEIAQNGGRRLRRTAAGDCAERQPGIAQNGSHRLRRTAAADYTERQPQVTQISQTALVQNE
jgi:hypothetical protein